MTRGTRTRRRRTRARRRIAVTAGLLAVALCALAFWGVWRWIARTPLVVLEQCTVAGDPDTALDTEQSSYAALIAAASVRRGLPPRAATIALATAMQESKLRNLDHGDRDSLGLFQQRPSQGWGQPAEIQDPYFATNRFYDALVQVRDYQNRPITEVAQEVQRSALPTAYARHETFGRHWASALTGYSPAALDCRLRAATQPGSAPQLTAGLVRDYGNTVSVSGPSRDNGAPTVSVTTGPNDTNDQTALHRSWSVAGGGGAPPPPRGAGGGGGGGGGGPPPRSWASTRCAWRVACGHGKTSTTPGPPTTARAGPGRAPCGSLWPRPTAEPGRGSRRKWSARAGG